MSVGAESLSAASRDSEILRVAVVAEAETVRRRVAAGLGRGEVLVRTRHRSVEALLAEPEAEVDVIVVCSERFTADEAGGVRQLKATFPRAVVIAVGRVFARTAVSTALAAGLDGCVLEQDVADCLQPAIFGARRGQLSLPRDLWAALRPALSVREKQILALVVMGFSNAEIAQKLYVSESTVKSHLSSAFARLGVRSRNAAAALILDPEGGLGAGILTISGDERRRGRA